MVRKARWESTSFHKGVQAFRLSSWKYFSDFISQRLLNFPNYIFRGHADSTWQLEPTLDRIITSPISTRREQHLERFKYETRGRRGANPPLMENENDWWALGQHHGLATPLLDWTESPFVALYFAVSGALKENSKNLTVFVCSQDSILERNSIIESSEAVLLVNGQKPTVKIVRPLSDENSRLVSQRGLFTRGPNNIDLETWFRTHSTESSEKYMELIRLDIPNKDLQNCLTYLNRMNISHSTLFPDLQGASEHCNNYLRVERY